MAWYGQNWSIEDQKLVAKLHREGMSAYAIGVELYRTEYAVKSVLRKLAMVKRAGIKANSKAFTTKMAMAENTLRRELSYSL